MNLHQSLRLTIGFVLMALFLNACGAPATNPSTAAPPAVSPTTTGGDIQQPSGEEKYEAVAIADYEPNMELSGRIQWDANGLISGGPVNSFSFWGQKIELASDMITGGFLSTKDYGKIMLKANPDGSMHLELTPSQQKRIKQLKK